MLGSLVRMKNEPYEVLGMVVKIMPLHRGKEFYKIEWFCDLCDVTYVDKWNLEIIC